MITVVSLILFAIVWLLHVMFNSDLKLVDDDSIKRAIDLGCTIAALLAVCIPEGMPLVISMAMAFSVHHSGLLGSGFFAYTILAGVFCVLTPCRQ